jgi:cell division protein FtsQ
MRAMNNRPAGGPGQPGGHEEVRVTSVILGLVMVIALIVTAAAWMGGSLSQMQSRVANFTDATARSLGVAVSDIAVIGLEHDHELAAGIRAAAMVEPGENMFRADPHIIRDRVEATGKVVNVRVHRLWPDQIVIMADPADPLALWKQGDSWTVIDEFGRAMAGQPASELAGLPRVTGAGAPVAAPDLLAQIRAHPSLARRLVRADRIDERRWTLHFDDRDDRDDGDGGLQVDFPEDSRFEHALARLVAANTSHAILDRPVAVIDLRADNQLVIRPLNASPEEGAA